MSRFGNRYKEAMVDDIILPRRSSSVARSLEDEEDFTMALEDESTPRVRVKLCLRGNPEHCGEYTVAESKFSRLDNLELQLNFN
jgi:echinoid